MHSWRQCMAVIDAGWFEILVFHIEYQTFSAHGRFVTPNDIRTFRCRYLRRTDLDGPADQFDLQVGDGSPEEANVRFFEQGFEQGGVAGLERTEEHTSELQSLMRISYAVFCLNNKNKSY